jgi:hypothetical protein
MAAKTIWMGKVMVKAAMVWGLSLASQRLSMRLYKAMESMASMDGQLIFSSNGRMGPAPRFRTSFFITEGLARHKRGLQAVNTWDVQAKQPT